MFFYLFIPYYTIRFVQNILIELYNVLIALIFDINNSATITRDNLLSNRFFYGKAVIGS